MEEIPDLEGTREFVTLDTGHVGLVMGRGAKKDPWPQVSDWLASRSG